MFVVDEHQSGLQKARLVPPAGPSEKFKDSEPHVESSSEGYYRLATHTAIRLSEVRLQFSTGARPIPVAKSSIRDQLVGAASYASGF